MNGYRFCIKNYLLLACWQHVGEIAAVSILRIVFLLTRVVLCCELSHYDVKLCCISIIRSGDNFRLFFHSSLERSKTCWRLHDFHESIVEGRITDFLEGDGFSKKFRKFSRYFFGRPILFSDLSQSIYNFERRTDQNFEKTGQNFRHFRRFRHFWENFDKKNCIVLARAPSQIKNILATSENF